VAGARLEEARRQYAAGQAAEIDFIRAQLQVLEQQTALRRLQQELAALGAGKK
jgi:outer membrane protein TolC